MSDPAWTLVAPHLSPEEIEAVDAVEKMYSVEAKLITAQLLGGLGISEEAAHVFLDSVDAHLQGMDFSQKREVIPHLQAIASIFGETAIEKETQLVSIPASVGQQTSETSQTVVTGINYRADRTPIVVEGEIASAGEHQASSFTIPFSQAEKPDTGGNDDTTQAPNRAAAEEGVDTKELTPITAQQIERLEKFFGKGAKDRLAGLDSGQAIQLAGVITEKYESIPFQKLTGESRARRIKQFLALMNGGTVNVVAAETDCKTTDLHNGMHGMLEGFLREVPPLLRERLLLDFLEHISKTPEARGDTAKTTIPAAPARWEEEQSIVPTTLQEATSAVSNLLGYNQEQWEALKDIFNLNPRILSSPETMDDVYADLKVIFKATTGHNAVSTASYTSLEQGALGLLVGANGSALSIEATTGRLNQDLDRLNLTIEDLLVSALNKMVTARQMAKRTRTHESSIRSSN